MKTANTQPRYKGINIPTGAVGAWGVFRVNGWTGKCFQIKRISDSALLDIGFTNEGIADWLAADQFCGGSVNLYNINKLYDQSGSGYDMTATTSNPIQWGNSVNGIRTITFNSGAVSQDLKNTSFAITDVRNTTCGWVGQFAYGNSSGSIFEVGNPTNKFWCGSVTNSGFVDKDTLSKGTICGPMVLTRFGNGASTRTTQMNDIALTHSADASSAATGVTLGNAISAAVPGRGEHLMLVIYDSVLSAAGQAQLTDSLYGASGLPRAISGDVCTFDGDSLTLGTIESTASYQATWIQMLMRQIGRPLTYFNLGVSGRTAATGASNAATLAARCFKTGKFNVAVIWYGTNDMGANVSAATAYASVQSICSAYKTAGFNKIICATCLPRNNAFSGGQNHAGFETARLAFNVLMRAGAGTDFDVLADIGADSVIGQDANVTTTYFFDLLHLTTLGQTYALPYFINALLSVL